MAYSPPIAVYDACVLYPFHLRNVLVQCAFDRLVDARWTALIHDEWIENLLAKAPGLTRARLLRTRDLMNAALPDADVSGYESYVSAVRLPDVHDRHVVAAGIAAGASRVITWNVRDFPAAELRRFGLRKQTPDAFLVELYSAVPAVIVESAANARRNLRRSHLTAAEFVDALKRQKLRKFAARLARHLSDI